MRIGTDLNASHLHTITIHARTPSERASLRLKASSSRGAFVCAFALISLCAGCNAVVNFGDFEFGPGAKQRDSGAAGEGGDGGGGGAGQPDKDGSVSSNDDGGMSKDGSVTGGAGGGSGRDGGDIDAGNGNVDSGMTCSSAVEICDNGVDDDCNSRIDCDDSDCLGQSSCCSATPENTQAVCGDSRDNDCNGKTDCGDLNCSGTLACCARTGAESTMASCTNGIDDDCDGQVDCVDPECAGMPVCCGIVTAGADPITPSCCVRDGLNEVDAPNDGKDNDCNGLVDIPVLQSAFPFQGLPSSADEVRLNFMTEINPNATLGCSTRRPGQPLVYNACPLLGTTVKPFTSVQSANPANNGLWITQVRWDFPDGRHSESFTFHYYVHSSLHNVSHCAPFHSDKQWFDVADTLLGVKDAGSFRLGSDTFLASPFIRVTYQVPTSGTTEFKLNGQTPSLDMWSLRRRFTLDDTNKYLLIQRNYKSTRSGSCSAAAFQIHTTHLGTENTFRTYTCQAVVLNRAGVGVCLDNGPSTTQPPVIVHPSNDPVANAIGWKYANKFMWRQLLEKSAGNTRNFTPKCATQSCPGIFLPDRLQFAP